MLFLKQPLMLPLLCYNVTTTGQIDSNKVSNSTLKLDPCNCVENEMVKSTAPPQQPHKRGTNILGHPVQRTKYLHKYALEKQLGG